MSIFPNKLPFNAINKFTRQRDLSPSQSFRVRAGLLEEFRIYATHCLPNELGGLLKVEHDELGPIATEFKLFSQLVDPVNFKLDGEAIAQWQMELLMQGKEEELTQWSGIIHSHPNMQPFMSQNDYNNLLAAAGVQQAWSVICTAGKSALPKVGNAPLELCHHYDGSLGTLDRNMKIISYGTPSTLDDKTIKSMQETVDGLVRVNPTSFSYKNIVSALRK